MAGTYEFWLTDDRGVRLADSKGETLLDRILSGHFQRVTNGTAQCSVRLPASFDTTLLQPDRMLQVWRRPAGGSLGLWRVYLLRWWRFARVGSDLMIEVQGKDANSLLDRRIVANYNQTVGSEKRAAADDMMKEIVDEQMVSDTSDPPSDFGSRTLPAFSVQAITSAGPILSKAIAWQKVSRVISDLERASWGAGNEVFWDIAESDISSTSIAFQFRTKVGQPGADRTTTAVFDEARGNLEASDLTYDWTGEASYIYGGGQGEDEYRNIQQVWDAQRIAVSRYGRIEAFANGRFSYSPEAVEAATQQQLMKSRPLRIFRGQAIDTAGLVYGTDWNWGDRVTARFLGLEFEAIIRQVVLQIDGSGRETVDARIESIEN